MHRSRCEMQVQCHIYRIGIALTSYPVWQRRPNVQRPQLGHAFKNNALYFLITNRYVFYFQKHISKKQKSLHCSRNTRMYLFCRLALRQQSSQGNRSTPQTVRLSGQSDDVPRIFRQWGSPPVPQSRDVTPRL